MMMIIDDVANEMVMLFSDAVQKHQPWFHLFSSLKKVQGISTSILVEL